MSVDDALHDLPTLDNGANVDVLSYAREAESNYAREMRGKLTECSGHLVSRNDGAIIERYPFVPPGGNWADIPEEMMGSYKDRMRCHTGIYRRLDPDRPSVVIGNFRKNMLIHPYEHRGLSVREAARLQSFPDSFVFKGVLGYSNNKLGTQFRLFLPRRYFTRSFQLTSRTSRFFAVTFRHSFGGDQPRALKNRAAVPHGPVHHSLRRNRAAQRR